MQRAKQTFFADGRQVSKGALFADSDPILKGREVLFEHVDIPEPMEPAESKPVRKTAAKKPSR